MAEAICKWLYDWQTLMAGVLGFGAGIVTVWWTLTSEARNASRSTGSTTVAYWSL
jgi:hypothetical protein